MQDNTKVRIILVAIHVRYINALLDQILSTTLPKLDSIENESNMEQCPLYNCSFPVLFLTSSLIWISSELKISRIVRRVASSYYESEILQTIVYVKQNVYWRGHSAFRALSSTISWVLGLIRHIICVPYFPLDWNFVRDEVGPRVSGHSRLFLVGFGSLFHLLLWNEIQLPCGYCDSWTPIGVEGYPTVQNRSVIFCVTYWRKGLTVSFGRLWESFTGRIDGTSDNST